MCAFGLRRGGEGVDDLELSLICSGVMPLVTSASTAAMCSGSSYLLISVTWSRFILMNCSANDRSLASVSLFPKSSQIAR